MNKKQRVRELKELIAKKQQELNQSEFISYETKRETWEKFNQEQNERKRELFFLETGIYNEFIDKNGRIGCIFSHNKLYTQEFIEHTKLNTLFGSNWTCYANFSGEENIEKKIRMSEIIPGALWNGTEVYKYMKKPALEETYKIKLSYEDRVNTILLSGFYSNGSYGYGGIFNVAAVLNKYESYMRKKWEEEWLNVKLPLLVAE